MTMTLEQVRDKLRRYAKDADNYFNRTRETLELTSAELLADAIDAHLLSQDAEIADLIGKRDFLLRHYNLAESRLAAANERLEAAERKVSRLTAMRNEWERDAREHLMTFGQHLPASVECLVERFDAAIAAAQEGAG